MAKSAVITQTSALRGRNPVGDPARELVGQWTTSKLIKPFGGLF